MEKEKQFEEAQQMAKELKRAYDCKNYEARKQAKVSHNLQEEAPEEDAIEVIKNAIDVEILRILKVRPAPNVGSVGYLGNKRKPWTYRTYDWVTITQHFIKYGFYPTAAMDIVL